MSKFFITNNESLFSKVCKRIDNSPFRFYSVVKNERLFACTTKKITSLNLNLLLVKGRSDLVLKIELIRRIWQILFLLIALPIGPLAICIFSAVSMQLSMILNAYYTGKFYDYGYMKQVKDFLPYFILASLCSIPSFLLIPISNHIFAGGILSSIIYIGYLWFRKDENFLELANLIRPLYFKSNS